MEFTIRIPKQVLIVIGAVLSVVAGAAAATLLPTAYQGQISYGVGRPWQSIHEPTSLAQYTIMSALALTIYLDAIAAKGRTLRARPHAHRPGGRDGGAHHRAGRVAALAGS